MWIIYYAHYKKKLKQKVFLSFVFLKNPLSKGENFILMFYFVFVFSHREVFLLMKSR
jgi:hypothetical protein